MLETISTLHRGFSGVLASLARLMIVIDSLIETGHWQFLMFDGCLTMSGHHGHPSQSCHPCQFGHLPPVTWPLEVQKL